MSFMQPHIEHGEWVMVDGNCGTDCIPADLLDMGAIRAWTEADGGDITDMLPVVRDYTENRTLYSIEIRKGWGARMSAPGYMDCTPWSVYDTEAEAREALRDETEEDDPPQGWDSVEA